MAELRRVVVTSHVAQRSRHSVIDGRTTRHIGYAQSQRRQKRIEEPFGWAKTVGGMAQTLYRGIERARARFTLTMGRLQPRKAAETARRLSRKPQDQANGNVKKARAPGRCPSRRSISADC